MSFYLIIDNISELQDIKKNKIGEKNVKCDYKQKNKLDRPL